MAPTVRTREATTKDARPQVFGHDLLELSKLQVEGATRSLPSEVSPLPCPLCPPSHARDPSAGVRHHAVGRGCQQWGGTCNRGLQDLGDKPRLPWEHS